MLCGLRLRWGAVWIARRRTSRCATTLAAVDATATTTAIGEGTGSTWRYRFDDVKTALLADEVGKRRGGRVFMCDTHEPPHEAIVPGSDDCGCDSDCKSSEGAIRVCDTIRSEDHPLYDTKGCDDDTFGKNCRILLHQHGHC
eukprot:jgi/Undpi1/5998/HiC_scaffold_2.g01272.m1